MEKVTACALARLLDYEEWANNETAAALAASGFAHEHRTRKIFAHIGATYTLWLSRLHLCPAIDVWPDPRTVDASALLASGYAMWRSLLNRDESFWSTSITYSNSKGETWSNTPRDIFTHIQLHSSYHRGQIAILFGHEGQTPAYTDFIEGARRSQF
ncbi:MAG: DinB family protein [Phycisphaerae bacterium]